MLIDPMVEPCCLYPDVQEALAREQHRHRPFLLASIITPAEKHRSSVLY